METKKYIASFLAVSLFLSNQVRAEGSDKEGVVKNIESVETTENKKEKISVGEWCKKNHTVLLSVGGAVVALCGGIVGGFFVSGYLADKANKKQGDDIKENLEIIKVQIEKEFGIKSSRELDELLKNALEAQKNRLTQNFDFEKRKRKEENMMFIQGIPNEIAEKINELVALCDKLKHDVTEAGKLLPIGGLGSDKAFNETVKAKNKFFCLDVQVLLPSLAALAKNNS